MNQDQIILILIVLLAFVIAFVIGFICGVRGMDGSIKRKAAAGSYVEFGKDVYKLVKQSQ